MICNNVGVSPDNDNNNPEKAFLSGTLAKTPETADFPAKEVVLSK